MSQWTIGRKIAGGFLLILIQSLAVGLFGLWTINRTSNSSEQMASQYLPATELAAHVEREFLNARIHFIYHVTIQKEGSLQKGWTRFRNAQQGLPKLQSLINRSTELSDIRPDVEQLRRDFASYTPVLERIIVVVKKGQNHGPEFDGLLKEWARLGGAMVDSAGRLNRRGSQATLDSARLLSSQSHSAMIAMVWACVAGLLIGVVLVVLISGSLTRALREIIQELGGSAHQVADAASQIAGSAQSLASGSSELAASLEETSSSSEEINSMASMNTDNSKTAAERMDEASLRIGEANRDLDQMVHSMNEINASSQKISRVIKVIDGIAFQTNILALNAAVEAARAGESGLGFSVVAEEVRNLAQRCAQAAQDTTTLIEESVANSNDGRSKLEHVSKAVRSITESADKARMLVDEVKMGSEEQKRGIEQVAKAIAQMEKVTQTTAANAEQSAAASEQLSAQSEAMRDVVVRLESMVGR